MSAVLVPIAVGSILTTVEELDALPPLAVIMADPEGRQHREDQRCMVLQKRADLDAEPCWYAARGVTKHDPAESGEDSAVHGAHYGPFLVLWLPAVAPAVEQLAEVAA